MVRIDFTLLVSQQVISFYRPFLEWTEITVIALKNWNLHDYDVNPNRPFYFQIFGP